MSIRKIFFDSEFSQLKQDTSLISLGIVSDNGQPFYAEFTDYKKDQIDLWLRENVISGLYLPDESYDWRIHEHKGDTKYIFSQLQHWLWMLSQGGKHKIEFWSDCLAYDWVLFCELFGGARNLPNYISYIPMDICTMFRLAGIDPDINREEYAGIYHGKKHNALNDAVVIKACYERLMWGNHYAF